MVIESYKKLRSQRKSIRLGRGRREVRERDLMKDA
jgi:hypothetical protein